MNNVLIFGMPRTATTGAQSELSAVLGLKNVGEPFCGEFRADDVYEWTRAQNNCVMKILTTNLRFQRKEEFHFENIDLLRVIESGITDIVVTQRNNLTDCCLSLYYAEQIAKQYHYTANDQVQKIEFAIDMDFVTNWLFELDTFYQTLDLLARRQIKYDVFSYDVYVKRHPQIILEHIVLKTNHHGYIHANINYAELCSNYQEVKTKIEDHVKRIRS